MKSRHVWMLLGLIGVLSMTGCADKTEELTQNVNTHITIDYEEPKPNSLENFGYSLFEENMDAENPVLSPVSAYLALSMAGAGAEGNTRQEFVQVLGEDMLPVADDLMNCLPTEQKSEFGQLSLSVANSAWLDETLEAGDEWLATVKDVYDAEAFRASLSSVGTMNDMNTWISKKTNGLIEKLLSEPLSEDAKMALINTLYFKGNWQKSFTAAQKEPFTKADGTTVEADMMHIYQENFEYVKNDLTRGVLMRYKTIEDASKQYAMLALLPQGDKSVREMYAQMTQDAEWLHKLLAEKEGISVNLAFPKFEVSYERKLNDSLINMGLQDAFDAGKADFTSIGKNDSLYISLVIQKAVVKTDELGTEAAAVTAMIAETAMIYADTPVDVYFDRPFLYMIVDMNKEIPLFIGIMDDPTCKS